MLYTNIEIGIGSIGSGAREHLGANGVGTTGNQFVPLTKNKTSESSDSFSCWGSEIMSLGGLSEGEALKSCGVAIVRSYESDGRHYSTRSTGESDLTLHGSNCDAWLTHQAGSEVLPVAVVPAFGEGR